MKNVLLSAVALVIVSLVAWKFTKASDVPTSQASVPVLVELFTSEGCSSCPPADALLQQLDRSQPVPGAQLIVLSEHVDYWNYIGWTDPFSSRFFSDRQSSYARRFGLATVYTPQMVIDGAREFVGSDSRLATQAIEKARVLDKVAVRISSLSLADARTLTAHLEADALPASSKAGKAEVYVAVALNRAESQVLRGENEGTRLTHVAVVRSLAKVGTLEKGKSFTGDVSVKAEPGADPASLRVIAFVQEPGLGRVLGAAVGK